MWGGIMKQTIGFNQFHDAFRDMDRLDNFSYDGLRVLYDWFEELDADCGTDTELDVIAICCEFSEENPDEIRHNFGVDYRGSDLLLYLTERTMVCGETSDTIVYQDF
jgi:methyl coenzyme M reductase alpha subunit